ncbi:MAG: gamma-glutamylcyclotransferase [Paracoccaceae bacterium]
MTSAKARQALVFRRIPFDIWRMSDNCFFGYGSLVNRTTHDYHDCRPAVLTGWRRVWRHTELRPAAFLTSVPAAGSEIDGLTALVPGGDWALLDQREHAYERSDIAHQLRHDAVERVKVQVYAIADGRHGTPSERHPILLSYLDVVVQGYLREFGEAGVARFFETTDGWEAPVRDDRKDPVYSRHQRLTADEADMVDQYLRALGSRII